MNTLSQNEISMGFCFIFFHFMVLPPGMWSLCWFFYLIQSGVSEGISFWWLHGTIFTVYSHTITLFWSKRHLWSWRYFKLVSKCLSSGNLFIFSKNFPFLFPSFVLFLLRYFHFHMVSLFLSHLCISCHNPYSWYLVDIHKPYKRQQ